MRKKNLDFEINLMPIISVLAVCISFLLISAVWVQGGSYHLTQALGSETEESKEKPTNLWVELKDANNVEISLRQGDKVINKSRVQQSKDSLKKAIEAMRAQSPETKIALVLPNAKSNFQDIINVMNELKANEFNDIGIAPL